MAASAPIAAPNETKPGYQTTEFWVTVLTAVGAIGTQFAGAVPQPWGLIVAAIATAAYSISRGLTKSAGLGGGAA